MTAFEIPLRLSNGLNAREHYFVRAKRVKSERRAVAWMLKGTPPAAPLIVTMTRIAPSAGLDSDNLISSCKALRDQIAEWLGVDDKHPSVKYVCNQRRGPWAVGIQIEAA